MIKLIGIQSLVITLEVDGEEEVQDLDELFSIDDTDMTYEYAHQVGLYGRFSIAVARAEQQYAKAKFTTQQEYAQADEVLRKQLVAEDKKFTEAVVKSLVLQDEEYLEVYEKELDAEHLYKLLRSILNAFNQRADMLISMGAHLRAEMGMTGMTIKDKQLKESISDVKEQVRRKRG